MLTSRFRVAIPVFTGRTTDFRWFCYKFILLNDYAATEGVSAHLFPTYIVFFTKRYSFMLVVYVDEELLVGRPIKYTPC